MSEKAYRRIRCKCGKLNNVYETYPEYLNWQCNKCYSINPFFQGGGYIFKCSLPTAKRNKE
jgi:phage FluMu protein Com